MKKLMFALMVFGGVAVVKAQDTTSTDKSQTQSSQYSTPQSTQGTQSTQSTEGTQSTQGTQGTQSTSQNDDRVRIQSQDLPDAVKRSLEGQEYRGWLVNGAYKSKGVSTDGTSGDASSSSSSTTDPNNSSTSSSSVGAAGQDLYVVELKNGAQTKTVRFDKDGKKLDDMNGGKDDQK
jgi:hypothetical protein